MESSSFLQTLIVLIPTVHCWWGASVDSCVAEPSNSRQLYLLFCFSPTVHPNLSTKLVSRNQRLGWGVCKLKTTKKHFIMHDGSKYLLSEDHCSSASCFQPHDTLITYMKTRILVNFLDPKLMIPIIYLLCARPVKLYKFGIIINFH